MAYDLIKQTHPGAPTVIGARVREHLSGRLGSVVHPRAGLRGIAVLWDGRFGVADCPPDRIAYAAAPPCPTPPWCAR